MAPLLHINILIFMLPMTRIGDTPPIDLIRHLFPLDPCGCPRVQNRYVAATASRQAAGEALKKTVDLAEEHSCIEAEESAPVLLVGQGFAVTL